MEQLLVVEAVVAEVADIVSPLSVVEHQPFVQMEVAEVAAEVDPQLVRFTLLEVMVECRPRHIVLLMDLLLMRLLVKIQLSVTPVSVVPVAKILVLREAQAVMEEIMEAMVMPAVMVVMVVG
jgi:hypothetical protein